MSNQPDRAPECGIAASAKLGILFCTSDISPLSNAALISVCPTVAPVTRGGSVAEWLAWRRRARVQIAVATLSGKY